MVTRPDPGSRDTLRAVRVMYNHQPSQTRPTRVRVMSEPQSNLEKAREIFRFR